MQTSTNLLLKNFTCPIHPSEVIERVCLDSRADSSLKCIECVLSDTQTVSKDSLIAFSEFIDRAAKQYQTFRRTSVFESAPSEELTKLLSSDEENIQKLCQHIEQEKERVDAAFNTMLQEFTQLCFQKKNEIYNQLDKQLATLKFNYSYYKSKLDQYYYHKDDELNNSNLETLISRINQCNNINQAEILVKSIKDDLQEASSNVGAEMKALQIKESFNILAQTLQEQAKTPPKTKFCDQAAIEKSLSDFRQAIDLVVSDFVDIDHEISKLSFTRFLSIDSKLIKSTEHFKFLQKWLAPDHKDFKLRLLYRGSRDGMDWDTFHKKCDGHDMTLTIAKSNHRKVFGGYSDKPWDNNSRHTESQDCWLFSIDEELKFPISKYETTNAIYQNINCGPTFGSGRDLSIFLPRKDTVSFHKCYSNLGYTYHMITSNKPKKKGRKVINPENHPENQTILAGSYQFDVEELEIFAVESDSNPNDSKLNSHLINPQDLILLKNWLETEKKYNFELIYRGSRDGFNSSDFHQNCDDKGPTLVVCKSKNLNKVFGGYTSKSWTKYGNPIEDQDAFLFSLTHKTKHPIIQKDKAISCLENCGPVFGAGPDLFVCSDCNTKEDSNSVLGVSYMATGSLREMKSYLAGDFSFAIDDIEAFTVETSEN